MRVTINGVEYTADGVVTLTPVIAPGPEPTPTPVPDPAPSPAPDPAPSPGGVVFFDRFNYDASRHDPNVANVFMAAGWRNVKSQQMDGVNAAGYVYTVNEIPGYTGQFPNGYPQALCIESAAGTFGRQTDFYLQLGDGENPAFDDYIPADCWMQVWIYPNYYGNQLSQIDNRSKWFYPCNGPYPCDTHKYLLGLTAGSYTPHMADFDSPSNGNAHVMIHAWPNVSEVTQTGVSLSDAEKLGQTDISEYIHANRWNLLKIHVNTSGEHGVFEAWIAPMGGSFTKVCDWRSGVFPSGFSWLIDPAHRNGHRTLKWPTTVSHPNGPYMNYWIYCQDFMIARSEADLPVY